jgi:hypothetical protein
MVEAVIYYEMAGNIYQTARCYIPEESHLQVTSYSKKITITADRNNNNNINNNYNTKTGQKNKKNANNPWTASPKSRY